MVAEVTVRHKNLALQKSKMRMTGFRMIPLLTRVLAVVLAFGVVAPVAHAVEMGQVTNLPLPRFVSLQAAEGHVRRGPSLTRRRMSSARRKSANSATVMLTQLREASGKALRPVTTT